MKYVLYVIVLLTILNSCSNQPEQSLMDSVDPRNVPWRVRNLRTNTILVIPLDSAYNAGDTVQMGVKIKLLSRAK